jgi:hypothetical protein
MQRQVRETFATAGHYAASVARESRFCTTL